MNPVLSVVSSYYLYVSIDCELDGCALSNSFTLIFVFSF